MHLAAIILIFMGLLLLAMVLEPMAQRLHLPFSVSLVAVGFFGAAWLASVGIDIGLRWYYFHDLVFYLLLPVLVFEAAFRMDAQLLFRNLAPVLIFAVPVTLLATGITAVLIYFGVGDPSGFPWLTAIIAGALLSATDPVGVLDLFKHSKVPPRLELLVEGESLFNDAVTIVLFTLLIAFVTGDGESLTWASGIWEFIKLFFGGALAGAGIGLLAAELFRLFRDEIHHAMITLMAAYASFLVADTVLGLSGVMAALACGLVLGKVHRSHRPSERALVEGLWSMAAWTANSFTFLLLGATITGHMFTENSLGMLVGIGSVLLARAIGTFGIGALVSWLPGIEPIPTSHRTIMFWGGLRGAVTLGLALSLPVELEGWWAVQCIAYGVILFTLIVQAPTMEPLLLRLKINSIESES